MTATPLIYPALFGRCDLGFVRVNGAGLGNCLFTYAHAVAIARDNNARILTPAWSTIAINAKLRGRRYTGVMRPHPDEVSGLKKAGALVKKIWRARRLEASAANPPVLDRGITILTTPYTFEGLHRHRNVLRQRIVKTMICPPAVQGWGTANYVAIHVRLGDFAAVDENMLDSGAMFNLRIPITWYVDVARRLRKSAPYMPLVVFSDGKVEDLAPLLQIDGVRLGREENDLAELLAMARARLLLGSHSTFSQWAAFLGNMPSIWRDRVVRPERPTDADIPLFHVDRDLVGFPDDQVLSQMLCE